MPLLTSLPQMLPLLLSALLLASGHEAPAAVGGRLHTALAPAGLGDPAAVASALSRLGLSSLEEVQLLDEEEAREMRSDLRQNEIRLGDRAKLRRAVGATLPGTGAPWRLQAEGSDTDGGTDGGTESIGEDSLQGPPRRRLQGEAATAEPARGEGLGWDAVAIVLTGLSAVLGYVLQACFFFLI
jgi:hypothetical protein